jgi:hypothetical protein
MPVKDQKKPAPKTTAPIEDHKKHADEFLANEKYKVRPATLNERNDEAKP